MEQQQQPGQQPKLNQYSQPPFNVIRRNIPGTAIYSLLFVICLTSLITATILSLRNFPLRFYLIQWLIFAVPLIFYITSLSMLLHRPLNSTTQKLTLVFALPGIVMNLVFSILYQQSFFVLEIIVGMVIVIPVSRPENPWMRLFLPFMQDQLTDHIPV